MPRCCNLDSDGTRCHNLAIEEIVIFKDSETSVHEESKWIISQVCKEHKYNHESYLNLKMDIAAEKGKFEGLV